MAYNVVFEGTGEEGSNYKGIRTFTSYESKEAFDKRYREKNRDVIVGEGVSDEEAHNLCRQTTIEARADALLTASIDSEGNFNEQRFDMEAFKFAAAIHDDQHGQERE